MPHACPPAGHSRPRPRLRRCRLAKPGQAFLRQAALRQAALRQADLRQADLRQAVLRQARRRAFPLLPPSPRPCRLPSVRAIAASVTPRLSPLLISSP
ncbi:hypothetical protein DBL07_21445 [Achromobacter mucicolens]|nr:hypothetical protein DBL07_21445 [Achromobacter mucicolens]